MYNFPKEFEGYNVEVLGYHDRIEYLKMIVRIAKTTAQLEDLTRLSGRDRFFAVWGDWLINQLEKPIEEVSQ